MWFDNLNRPRLTAFMSLPYAGLFALVVSTAVAAQSRTWEIGALAGGGPSIVTASLGGVPEGQLLITSLSVTRSFLHWKPFTVSYFGEVLPFVVVTRVPKAEKVWFHRPSPDDSILVSFPNGEGPLRLGKRDHRSYIVGYRFTHLSNAFTALENPGFNAHVFYLGITLR
jgi:hypothetical protein